MIRIYFTVSTSIRWLPSGNIVWGECLHWVLGEDLEDKYPVSRTWEIELDWLWFRFSIAFEKNLPEFSEEEKD